jgi:hypothetical protein
VDSVQLENNMKKIYFDGCSYTYGQSLELYCNPLDIFSDNRMSKYVFTKEDINFITKNRYSAIVSNHFRFIEKNNSINGKSNGKILFDLKKENIEEYEYVIIQLSHFDRFFTNNFQWTPYPFTIENIIKEKKITQKQVDYTIDNIEKIQLEYFLELEKLFVNYPNKLKIIFHSNEWENILSKEQIEKYGVSMGDEYMIRKWAENNNMFINQQPKFKKHITSSEDTHLSIEGHTILAQSIIKQL